MSTNKSRNFQLHLWEPEDDFLRAEFNENFQKLDGAAKLIFGTYTGDGAESRHIELGFSPDAVLLMRENGEMGFRSDGSYGGLMMRGHPVNIPVSGQTTLAALDDSGFTVCYLAGNHYFYANQAGIVFHYMAITC